MVTFQPEEKTRIKRQREEQAIQLAMQSRWEEAVAVNQSIIDLFPNDVDSYNRLGKALNELGRYVAARSAYGRALELDPSNSIARKNHQRLAALKEAAAPAEAPAARVDPQLFIEERGKTAMAILQRPAPREVLAKVNAGDQVTLRQSGRSLRIETAGGEYLGTLDPKLGLRVIKMMEGGNRYAAAVTNVQDSTARVIIKEVFQSPAMVGQVSFPSTADLGVRPYTRESLLKYGNDDEEDYSDENEDAWGDEEGRRGGWTNESDDFGSDDVSPLPEDDDSDDNDEE